MTPSIWLKPKLENELAPRSIAFSFLILSIATNCMDLARSSAVHLPSRQIYHDIHQRYIENSSSTPLGIRILLLGITFMQRRSSAKKTVTRHKSAKRKKKTLVVVLLAHAKLQLAHTLLCASRRGAATQALRQAKIEWELRENTTEATPRATSATWEKKKKKKIPIKKM